MTTTAEPMVMISRDTARGLLREVGNTAHTRTLELALNDVDLAVTKAGGEELWSAHELTMRAAARDLYAACVAMTNTAAPTRKEHPAMFEAWTFARAAIAKAGTIDWEA